MKNKSAIPAGYPQPSFFHIRLQDEEGEVLPHGGATAAFYLLPNTVGEPSVMAHVGIAVCSEEDHFVKKVGRALATARLLKVLRLSHPQEPAPNEVVETFEEGDELFFKYPVATVEELQAESVNVQVLATVEGLNFLTIKEEDVPVVSDLVNKVMEYIKDFRTHTYEGHDADVLDSIEEMFETEDSDDQPEFDIDEDDAEGLDDLPEDALPEPEDSTDQQLQG